MPLVCYNDEMTHGIGNQSKSAKALFVHHSVGRLIIDRGGLRTNLRNLPNSIELWDHDYNKYGLSDGSGVRLGRSFPVPADNTDPDGLLTLLRAFSPGGSLESELASFQVLLIKSCYPNSRVDSDSKFESLTRTYSDLREVASALDIDVVLVTTPPLAREKSTSAQRSRAVALASWLGQYWPGDGLHIADIFSVLISEDGALAPDLRRFVPFDSHPNDRGARVAAQVIGATLEQVSRR